MTDDKVSVTCPLPTNGLPDYAVQAGRAGGLSGNYLYLFDGYAVTILNDPFRDQTQRSASCGHPLE